MSGEDAAASAADHLLLLESVSSAVSSTIISPTEDYEDKCPVNEELQPQFKIIFVGVVGLCVALSSICCNSILFYSFASSKLLRKRNLIYLTCISACDIGIALSYIALFPLYVYADYFKLLWLYVLWHKYLVIAFTASHITMCSSSMLLVAATMERYLQSTGSEATRTMFVYLRHHQRLVILICIAISVIIRGTVFFEFKIIYIEECDGFASMEVSTSPLTSNRTFNIFWTFYFRKISTVFLPFIVLAYFNAAIVWSVRRNDQNGTVKTLILYVTVGSTAEACHLRSRVRTATRMLVMVVFGYILSNVIDVTVAVWEYVNLEGLRSIGEFYTIVTDISSVLPILAAALRLPIYTLNDPIIQQEVQNQVNWLLYRLFNCCPLLSRLPIRRKFTEYKARSVYDGLMSASHQLWAVPNTATQGNAVGGLPNGDGGRNESTTSGGGEGTEVGLSPPGSVNRPKHMGMGRLIMIRANLSQQQREQFAEQLQLSPDEVECIEARL